MASAVLGLELRASVSGLRFRDPETGRDLLTHAESSAAQRQAEAERRQAEAERQQERNRSPAGRNQDRGVGGVAARARRRQPVTPAMDSSAPAVAPGAAEAEAHAAKLEEGRRVFNAGGAFQPCRAYPRRDPRKVQ